MGTTYAAISLPPPPFFPRNRNSQLVIAIPRAGARGGALKDIGSGIDIYIWWLLTADGSGSGCLNVLCWLLVLMPWP
jgi:hypothetical protein